MPVGLFRRQFFCIVTGFSLLFPASAAAFPDAPFFTRHLSPVSQLFGIPPAEGGRLSGKGDLDVRLLANAANSYSGGSGAGESLSFVGESSRYELALRYGLARGVELGIDLPWITHQPGYLNDLIGDFHDLFGLSSEMRKTVEDDEIHYVYRRGGVTRFSVTEETDGPGDISMYLAVSLLRNTIDRALALRAGVKLPTGDPNRLTGSGGTEYSLRLTGTDAASLARWRITWVGGAGIVIPVGGDILPEMQRDVIGTGFLGAAWRPLSWLALKAQIDFHSPLYDDSGIRELASWSQQVAAGFTFSLPSRVYWDLAVTENVFEETSPDVVLHSVLRRTF